ncbi:TATA-binding associated phosphoprotein [Entamoeba marina]
MNQQLQHHTSFVHHRINREARLRYMQNRRDMKDVETFQQSLLLVLLNKFCGFTLETPRKQTIVTLASPTIKAIHFDDETIKISDIADNFCRPAFESDIKSGMKRDSAIRRLEKNKRTFIHNFLFDVLLEKGFFFDSKLSRKTSKTLRIERISRVYYQSQCIVKQNKIVEYGMAVSNHLYSLLSTSKQYIIQKNDPILSGFIALN